MGNSRLTVASYRSTTNSSVALRMQVMGKVMDFTVSRYSKYIFRGKKNSASAMIKHHFVRAFEHRAPCDHIPNRATCEVFHGVDGGIRF